MYGISRLSLQRGLAGSLRCAARLPRRSVPTSAVSTSRLTLASSHAHFSASPAASSSNVNPPLQPSETFLTGPSASYIEEMYDSWTRDPKSVHLSWQIYFRNLYADGSSGKPAFIPPPTITPSALGADGALVQENLTDHLEGTLIPANEILDHMKVQLLVRAYQVRGHQLADLDPLKITVNSAANAPELDPAHYGFKDSDLERKFLLGQGILPGFLANEKARHLTLREIVSRLKKTYCGSIGIEYGHINDRQACDWLRQKFEVPVRYNYSKAEKLVILDRLMWSDSFERFVATKYPSEKRFGLEGCESLIPAMKAMIDRSVELGVNSVVMGMPHRGRLNVLSNVVRKPNESIFSEFAGSRDDIAEGSGDVKYHLGMNYIRPTPSGKMVHLSLAANPSHLEAVNPVVQGKVRAIQFYQGDEADRNKAIAVLLHGDAAFSGQGVVYETLGLSDLPAYTTGGSIHIVVNNQVGFTTDPRFSRSTPYCSDVAKTVSAPILHVNGDDVEAVVYSMELAAEWRAKYKKDVVIDVVCYRKHGHNEIDQPGFTQPLMYQKISSMKPVVEKYTEQLLAEGTVTPQEVQAMKDRVWSILEENYAASKSYVANNKEWVSSNWTGFKSPAQLAEETVISKPTGVDTELLTHIGISSASYPQGFTVHPNLAKILKGREKTVKDGEGIDWATAEAMAYGTLLAEGTHVRLSGQDVERGTFSQRHAVLHDQKNEGRFVPLNNLVVAGIGSGQQSTFTVTNSSLSEFGILGFELGYSMVSPNQLVLWEAQFGDFANSAQIMIDQFIASGEQKWLQRTGLTLLLPHGYDGQGPEHSSARMERFLQLCDQDPYYFPEFNHEKGSYPRQHQDCNMQVIYPTVPSNYFHALRRQVHREFRKPLVVFTSKNLLRHPLAKSSLVEMGPGTRFQRLIPEVLHPNALAELEPIPRAANNELQWSGNCEEPRIPLALSKSQEFQLLPPNKTRTVIFCSGQVYYLLAKARALNKLDHVAIVRIEQLNPFPFWEVKQVIDFYGESLQEIVWAQEEPYNSGAWTFVEPRLETAVKASNWFKSELNSTQEASSSSTSTESEPKNSSFFSRLFSSNDVTNSTSSSSSPSPSQPPSLSLGTFIKPPKTKGEAWQRKMESDFHPGGLLNARESNGNPARSVRGSRLIRYAGRDISAAPATGLKKVHSFEEKMLVSEALLGGELRKPVSVEQGVPVFY
ncbi:2-oxoglutarate dehydrogenase E1 component [Phlyctochytrium planicorne]|nr:2-oxoglutarate dehydrogenase E1 component [Phlyctochytrium planicorne]